MPLTSLRLRRFVKHALLAATDQQTPTPRQLASSFDLLCERLRARLHPLFGSAAIAALFERAVRVTTAEFPWLGDVVPGDGERCVLEGLDRVSGTMDAETVGEGLAAVLAQEIGLLSSFVGEDLVMPIVQAAWDTTAGEPMRIEGDHE